MNKTTWAWLLVAASTVVGGFLTGAGQYLMDAAQHGFDGASGWRAFAVGAVGAGMVGVSGAWHRFAPAPAQLPKDGAQ